MKLNILLLVLISGSSIMRLHADLIVADASPQGVSANTAESAKEQIEAATKAYDKKKTEFMNKLRTEKDRKKVMEMNRTERPDPSETVDLILQLAKDAPKAEGIEKGLNWTLKNGNTTQCNEAGDILLTHYKDSKSIADLTQHYGRMSRGGEVELRKIIEKAGSEKVRQGATYYLAKKLIKKAETKDEGLTLMKGLATTLDSDKSNPKLLAQVKGEINVVENLSIGCTAPDIVGTDHEGKEFKLSDYRGQVVLLDFWGIW